MRRGATLVGCVLAAGALVASACGTRLDDKDFARVDSGLGGGQPAGQGAATGSESGMFGTLDVPCSDGDTSDYPAAPDIGVTQDTIKIATISDPGGPKPGLNQGVFDSMEAFVAWCNDLGGINGRTLVLELLDGKVLQYNEAVAAACEDAFALVGGIGVLDNLGTATQLNCGLVNVPAAAVNPEQSSADLTFHVLPNVPWSYKTSPAEWIAEEFPEATARGAAIYSDLPVTEMQSARLIEAYEQVGFNFVAYTPQGLTDTNWGPIVNEMKNKDVTYMNFQATYEELMPLAKEMALQDVRPLVELEANYYNDKFLEQNVQSGGVADGFLIRAATWPLEEADTNPGMAQFLDIMEQYKPDGVLEYLGVQGFSAALYFATAASAVGPDLTREALMTELDKIETWDGGGIQSPTRPPELGTTSCFIMLKIEGDQFLREYPKPDEDAEVYNNDIAPGYACPDSEPVELDDADYRNMGMTIERAKDLGG